MSAIVLSTPENKKSHLAFFGLAALCLMAFPEFAAASGGITEFSSPLEQVVNTITGPAGKWISIVAIKYVSSSLQNSLVLSKISSNYRKLFPFTVHHYPVKSLPGVGRHVGKFLLVVLLHMPFYSRNLWCIRH